MRVRKSSRSGCGCIPFKEPRLLYFGGRITEFLPEIATNPLTNTARFPRDRDKVTFDVVRQIIDELLKSGRRYLDPELFAHSRRHYDFTMMDYYRNKVITV